MSDAVPGHRPRPREGTRSNGIIRYLRKEGPAMSEELPNDIGSAVRHSYVAKLHVSRGNARKSRGRAKPVYYLYGDERRAVRKFIRENLRFVEESMEDNVNTLNMRLDDVLWQMMVEEWVWSDRGEEYR